MLLIFFLLCLDRSAGAAEPSLGEKIRNFLATPTPTPSHRRHKSTSRKISPTPSASPSASPKAKTKRKHKPSPTPASEEDETPRPKHKKSSPTPSPSPSPTESPSPTPEESPTPTPSPTPSATPRVATVSPNDIKGYDDNPETVRRLLDRALELTKRDLKYTYGSADPANGGMDCSGFIYYVLSQGGLSDVPRDASEQYVWVRKSGNFRAVLSRELDSFEFDELKPGDLLFWTGTYSVERDPPVTHIMIYLGKEKATGKPIMVGASDGRTYEGKQQFGVSVFDFKTPRAKAVTDSETQPRFVGYGSIPGLEK